MGNCHKAALCRRVVCPSKEVGVVSVSNANAHTPTTTLDLPDLTSGVWAAAPAACFFTSTSIEAFDDLSLWFGSRPRHWRRFPSPSRCPYPANHGSSRRHESQDANKPSAFLGQKSPFATSPWTFFLIELYLVCSAFFFQSSVQRNYEIHDTN
jgi:hypothetical protein